MDRFLALKIFCLENKIGGKIGGNRMTCAKKNFLRFFGGRVWSKSTVRIEYGEVGKRSVGIKEKKGVQVCRGIAGGNRKRLRRRVRVQWRRSMRILLRCLCSQPI